MPTTTELSPLLRRLRLSGVLESLEVRNRQAIESQMSYVEFLATTLQDEAERREQKKLSLRFRRGNFDVTKTLENFDWSFNPRLNKQQIFDLATCQFIEARENILLLGQTGVGKSHLAQALAHQACRLGHDVLVTNTAKLLARLNGGRADGSYERRVAAVVRVDLLVLDDFGLTPIRPPASEDLYEIISERYERGSIIVTSNRAFEEWPALFNEPLLANAALDRLRHHAHLVEITGQSFRGAAHTEGTGRGRSNLADRPAQRTKKGGQGETKVTG